MKKPAPLERSSQEIDPERIFAASAGIVPLQRATLPQEIVKAIAQLIRRGEWKADEMIPAEKELAAMFGVGRSTIREAVKSLAVMGVIESRAGEGSFLRQPSSEMLAGSMMWGLLLSERNLEDLLETRILLEVECAGKAAERRGVDVPDKLVWIVENMKTSFRDYARFMALDNEFHVLLAKSSGNVLYSTMAETVQGLVRTWYSATYDIPGTMDKTIGEHLRIVDAVRDRDSAAAKEAMRAHLTQAGSRLRIALE
ncbi:FadR/GntR family transcriptional regulator [Rhizobium sp. S152]|uniref:FadR/GntR family transcriptional regulator n=1 Tax=Rhizobium sp. S152 TaxID=3055038 RepID=UPI0025A9FA86|nr:FadR/GntR family transcriptional regulator [Rhizobium sp. S152]MDM9625084.1 FadR/GntR family transcriptional regulator [Rhizobium sp. S152]